MRLLLAILFLPLNCFATAYTSTQDGPWSSSATWGGSGVPGSGDTATTANNVFVDVNTTVGTSPNDNTTLVLTLAADKTFTITNGVTLTLKGNLWGNFPATLRMLSGSSLTFDNSGSGGSPVYRSRNYICLNTSGTSNSMCNLSAISGQTARWESIFPSIDALISYAKFQRFNFVTTLDSFGSFTLSNCVFDGCGLSTFSDGNSTSRNRYFLSNRWTNSAASPVVRIDVSGSNTGGQRVFSQNISDNLVRWTSNGFVVTTNYFGNGLTCGSASSYGWSLFRNNFSVLDSTANAGNGALMDASSERNYYFAMSLTNGNPHFLAPTANNSLNNTVSQSIFEAYTPDSFDIGDCLLFLTGASSGGFHVIGANNIVLKDSFPATDVASGDFLTYYNDNSTITEWYRNTANVDLGVTATALNRAMFDTAEASNMTSNQIAALKSNLGWATSSTNGHFLSRISGGTQGIVTPAGADYNWTYGLAPGNNQRFYHGWVTTNTMWAAGDAVAASVDVHQGTGNPQFYDSSRNLAKWCLARGYGTQTYTNALTVLQSDLTKIPDLINYVFEGYRPGNSACRNAAHDGGVVGAANYYKSTRTLGLLNAYSAGLSAFGL